MRLYLKILVVTLFFTILINVVYVSLSGNSMVEMFLYLILAIAICGFSSAFIMLITRILPKKVFNPYRKRYKTFNKESNFYNKIGIKKWKDKVPELGKIGGFAKNKLNSPNDPGYLYRFLTEICIAESLHTLSIIMGALIFFILPPKYLLTIALPIFLINGILHILPVLIQRYLRPKMLKIYTRLAKDEDMKKEIIME